jgi:hypothetical protein
VLVVTSVSVSGQEVKVMVASYRLQLAQQLAQEQQVASYLPLLVTVTRVATLSLPVDLEAAALEVQ